MAQEDFSVPIVAIYFRYEVGDFVTTAWDAMSRKGPTKDREALQVIERCYSEHAGGSRISYVCRSQTIFGDRDKKILYDENELASLPIVEPERIKAPISRPAQSE